MNDPEPLQPWEEQEASSGRAFRYVSELSHEPAAPDEPGSYWYPEPDAPLTPDDVAGIPDLLRAKGGWDRANGNPPDTRAAALCLVGSGFAVCKPDSGEKKPTYPGWPTRSLDWTDFAADDMIGVLGGPLSNGKRDGHALVIVDLDASDAVERADEFLPKTDMTEGRLSKERSHRYYLVPCDTIPEWGQSAAPQGSAAAREQTGHPGPFLKHFHHRETGKGVLDFIGTGGQAVCPPSIWVSKDGTRTERREWTGGYRGEPAVVPFVELWNAVCELAKNCGCDTPNVPPRDPEPPRKDDPKPTASTYTSASASSGSTCSALERAIKYLNEADGSVSGAGGHDALFWAARCLVWGFCLSTDDSFAVLKTHFNPRCDPPWSDREIAHKVKEADTVPFGKPRGWLRDAELPPDPQVVFPSTGEPNMSPPGPSAASAPAQLPLIFYGDIQPSLDTSDFVEGLLQDGAMSVIFGETNTGKTFFVLDLALHVAAGIPWRGKEVDRRGVLYLALEGAHGIKNRISAFKKCGTNAADIALAVVPVSVNLLDPKADVVRVVEAAKRASEKLNIPVGMIVVDTLSRALAGGNENDSEAMGALVKSIDTIRQALPAHVAIVHHSGKDAARGARGHSLLKAAIDTEIEITAVPSAKCSVARVTKQRDMEVAGEFPFRLEQVLLGTDRRGKDVTSCVVREAVAYTKDRKLSCDATLALTLLRNLIDTQGENGFSGPPSEVPSVPSKWWRERFYTAKKQAKVEARRKAFERATKELRTAKLVDYTGTTDSPSDRAWIVPGQDRT